MRKRRRRHVHVRRRLSGTALRPRVSVFRSLKGLYVQLIDDEAGRTLLTLSTRVPEIRSQLPYGGNVRAATVLGEKLGQKAKEAGITRVVFDRGGYKYHGRIKALAEALRKQGLEF